MDFAAFVQYVDAVTRARLASGEEEIRSVQEKGLARRAQFLTMGQDFDQECAREGARMLVTGLACAQFLGINLPGLLRFSFSCMWGGLKDPEDVSALDLTPSGDFLELQTELGEYVESLHSAGEAGKALLRTEFASCADPDVETTVSNICTLLISPFLQAVLLGAPVPEELFRNARELARSKVAAAQTMVMGLSAGPEDL